MYVKKHESEESERTRARKRGAEADLWVWAWLGRVLDAWSLACEMRRRTAALGAHAGLPGPAQRPHQPG